MRNARHYFASIIFQDASCRMNYKFILKELLKFDLRSRFFLNGKGHVPCQSIHVTTALPQNETQMKSLTLISCSFLKLYAGNPSSPSIKAKLLCGGNGIGIASSRLMSLTFPANRQWVARFHSPANSTTRSFGTLSRHVTRWKTLGLRPLSVSDSTSTHGRTLN